MIAAAKAGLARSASLLRALGPSAAPVWAELDPADATAIEEAMTDAPRDTYNGQQAARTLLQDAEQGSATSIWQRLSALRTDQLASLLKDEHPQIIALTLSRIEAQAAAAMVRQAPALLATDVLQRMLHTAPPQPVALAVIERIFEDRIGTLKDAAHPTADETVARIFDALPAERGETLLQALQQAEHGASERVRALMFTFDDIAGLGPAGIQTLLARADRATLTLAMKGVQGAVADAIFRNMTARAREALREDMAALGPRTRFDVETARAALVALTRTLMDTGDIKSITTADDEELIE